MKRYLHKILFLLIAFIASIHLWAKSPAPTKQDNTDLILALWSNTNINHYSIYPVSTWEKMFEKSKENAINKKADEQLKKINLALAYIYHDQAKFKEALPLLEALYHARTSLSAQEQRGVLIKLEEEYRNFGDMIHAIEIRNLRIKNGDINTYWELYRDCNLLEAAKIDFLQFQKMPPKYSERSLFLQLFLGDIYFDLQQYDSAYNLFQKGILEAQETIELNKKTKKYRPEDLTYYYGCFVGNIGKIALIKKQYQTAIPKLLLDIQLSYENLGNKISKMLYLSDAYLQTGETIKAKMYLDSAHVIITGKTMKWIQLHEYKSISNYYAAINRNDSALKYLHLYANEKDALNDRVQKNQSLLLLAKLEINNRRAELSDASKSLAEKDKKVNNQQKLVYALILILVFATAFGIALYRNYLQKSKNRSYIEQQNKLLTLHAEKIDSQNAKNEILLKELHHRVKNNLQVMYSLLNLQKRRNEEDDIKSLLSSVQNRIQTMALVHQNLYTTGDFEMVDATSYIKTLVNHLQSIYQTDQSIIEIRYDIEPLIKLPIEKVVSIGLIVNEAVSNSFKYAFTQVSKGILSISIKSTENHYIIEISDNGPGFINQSIKENSLGLKLIKVMCAQLQADYSLEHIQGVKHHIEFYK